MAQLTANKQRYLGDIGINEIPVKASTVIYAGSAVGIDSGTGYARQLVANDVFVGFALQKADNGSGANAAINVKVQTQGFIQAALTVAATDMGVAMYMSDGDTFTKTSTGNSLIGKVYRFIDTSTCIVKFGFNGVV